MFSMALLPNFGKSKMAKKNVMFLRKKHVLEFHSATLHPRDGTSSCIVRTVHTAGWPVCSYLPFLSNENAGDVPWRILTRAIAETCALFPNLNRSAGPAGKNFRSASENNSTN
jgi:hypothetical protein